MKSRQESAVATSTDSMLEVAKAPEFTTKDLALLSDAVSLFPDLEAATYATMIALQCVTFPIATRELLISSLRKGRYKLRVRQHSWSTKDIERFMPANLFPIVDRADLLRKSLIACSSGSRFHYHEQQARLSLPNVDSETSSGPSGRGRRASSPRRK